MFSKLTLAALHIKLHFSFPLSLSFHLMHLYSVPVLSVCCNVCKDSVPEQRIDALSADVRCAAMYLAKSLNEFSIQAMVLEYYELVVCVCVFSTCSVRNFKRNQFTWAM